MENTVEDFKLENTYEEFMEKRLEKAKDPLVNKQFQMKNAFVFFKTFRTIMKPVKN